MRSRSEGVSLLLRKMRRPSQSLRCLVQAVLFDLVEKGFVTDAEDLGGFLAVPPGPRQHPEDQLAFRFTGGRARDVLERDVRRGARARVSPDRGHGIDTE